MDFNTAEGDSFAERKDMLMKHIRKERKNLIGITQLIHGTI
ncbi:MAG: hypothetical protein Q8M29_19960 [Bacteroidota bacterium]|nr:hypothetical protein [Bacteroidota bacterium]